jgi:dTDP-3-amino-3,4,6-trideoxy-alpha-D-glucose transaminase
VTAPPRVPTKDYARQYRLLWDELAPVLQRTLVDDDPILGAAVERFEAALARYHGVAHAVGVGTGTDAIVRMIRGLGLGPGDEVVTGAHTFSGVVSALVLAGVEPRLVDADPDTGLVDAGAVAAALGPRTRAVLAVHLYGRPVDLTALAAVCAARGVVLLEDAAQAHGARHAGRPVGGFGAAAALSFHPSKNLGAFGDGGAVLTDSADLAARIRIERNLGKADKYRLDVVAPNTKLDTLQAAILEVKLRHLDAWIERRRALAARYHAGLAGVGDLALPSDPDAGRHAYHLYVVRTARRDELRAHLDRRGVATGLHYPIAAPRQPAFAGRFDPDAFPVADAHARTGLTLPLSHEHTDAEVDRVIEAVRELFGVS